MTLQSSGAISLDDIHVEAGGSTGSQATINDADIRAFDKQVCWRSDGVQ